MEKNLKSVKKNDNISKVSASIQNDTEIDYSSLC
jgi:hypothetical protein